MEPITVLRQVRATPERMFAVATDLDRVAERVPAIRRIELLSQGPMGNGTRFRATRHVLGKDHTEVMEVLEHDPPRVYVTGCETHGFKLVSRLRFTPRDGGTELELTLEALPMNLTAKMMGALAQPMLAKLAGEVEKDLAALAAVAEGATEPAS